MNHPGIAAIYGIEEQDDTRALVLELVEGPTLADRIAQGPIPVDEALPIAKQIAEALEAAHEQGIIHRDLKPANIKVKDDGTVKVLDFGLAKALNPSPQGDPSESPTLTAAATQMGVIMGTAAYMSPEQARGKPVDKRADVWAFGVVLYEMLTGRRPFGGDDVSKTLARVIDREPNWAALPDKVPPVLSTFLRRCLQKNPKQRIHDIGDVRLAVEGAFETAVLGAVVTEPQPTPLWQRPVPLLLAATALVTGGILVGRALSSAPPAAPTVTRMSVVLPDGVQYVNSSSPSHGLAVSPDGTQIVYRGGSYGQTQLFRRSLEDLAVEPLPGTEGGMQPFFSPDGASVGFITQPDYELKRVRLDGRSPPVTVVEGLNLGSAGVWRDDGIVYSLLHRGVFRVAPDGGTPVELLRAAATVGRPGRLVLVPETGDLLVEMAAPSDSPWVALLVSESGESHRLLDDARLVALTASGRLLFERDGVVLAALFDLNARTVGPATPVLNRVAYDAGSLVPQVAVSASGTLAYVPVRSESPVTTLRWADRDGSWTAVGELPAGSAYVDLSPNGTLAMVGTFGTPRRTFLWDVSRQVPTGLEVEGLTPRWHPDGRHVALSRGADLLLLDVEDSSETTLVATTTRADSPSFTADGATLAFRTRGESTSQDIFALLPGESEPRPVVATAAEEHSPALSPDGRWLAYVSDESGSLQVYVVRFPSGTGRRRVTSTGMGNEPLWRRDGRALFFKEGPIGGVMDLRMVSIGLGDTLDLGASETLFVVSDPAQQVRTGWFWNVGATYQANADGTRFLMVWHERPEPATEIVVVQNWHQELLERVPID